MFGIIMLVGQMINFFFSHPKNMGELFETFQGVCHEKCLHDLVKIP